MGINIPVFQSGRQSSRRLVTWLKSPTSRIQIWVFLTLKPLVLASAILHMTETLLHFICTRLPFSLQWRDSSQVIFTFSLSPSLSCFQGHTGKIKFSLLGSITVIAFLSPDTAFLLSDAHVTAMLQCLEAVEQNNPRLLAQIDASMVKGARNYLCLCWPPRPHQDVTLHSQLLLHLGSCELKGFTLKKKKYLEKKGRYI